jgi:HEPN domain-containing protein
MDDEIKNVDNLVRFWRESSDQNYTTMHNLINSRDFSWALFLGHLVIEKLLKAVYISRVKKHPPFTHDLLRLANKLDLKLPDGYDEWLDAITTFNLNARYDDYKQNFYRLCTVEFTTEWVEKIETIRVWLIKQL